jgi:S1-C subfamily serine protease
MVRAAIVATLLCVSQAAGTGQAPGVLQIRASLRDAGGNLTPVPRHTLLVSDNPSTALPRVVVTSPDGTAQVRLPPGNYTVESEEAITFRGQAYRWTEVVQIAAGRDAVLELTMENAEVEPASAASKTTTAESASDPSFLLPQWQNSVVEVWTPTAHASGFVVDASGLIATSRRAVGAATSVEVQLTSELKVAARVLATDATRDVAVLWIDPKVAASARPVPLNCAEKVARQVEEGQEIFTIAAAPLRQRAQQKEMTSGTVLRVASDAIVSDLLVASGTAGGPVFASDGTAIGMTSLADDEEGSRESYASVIPTAALCDVVATAQANMQAADTPSGTPLPVEPTRGFPANALSDRAGAETAPPGGYSIASSDFHVTFITPAMISRAQYQSTHRMPASEEEFLRARAVTDFSNWSEYVRDVPPVLFIRATPKLVEGFWTKVGRGAARTQGIAIPPIKRFKSGFSRMRAFCGDAEVTPIHPFKLELEVPKQETIYEGLYVFDPGALGPHCGTVKLVLYSDKQPETGDTKVVEPGVIQQTWKDLEPYRDLSSPR